MKLNEIIRRLQDHREETVISAEIVLSDGTQINKCTYDNGWGVPVNKLQEK